MTEFKKLTQRVKNSTLEIPVHPKPLDFELEKYASAYYQNMIMSKTGIASFNQEEIQSCKNLEHSKQKAELEKRIQEKLKQNEALKRIELEKAKLKEREELKKEQEVFAKNKKKLEKLYKEIPHENYYENLPIQPGFEFFKALIVKRKEIGDLEINIPDSLLVLDRNYYACTFQGTIKVLRDYKVSEFCKGLKDSSSKNAMKKAAVAFRTPVGTYINTTIMEVKQFFEFLRIRESLSQCLIQKYVKSQGDCPSVTRIFYFNNQKEKKGNYGLVISYLKPKLSNEVADCLVDSNDPYHLELVKISGHTLRPYEKQVQNIIYFIEKTYCLRVEQVTLDFVKDSVGKVWFCGCRGFKIDLASLNKRYYVPSSLHRKSPDSKSYCGLCSEVLNNSSKVVGESLFNQFKTHLLNRKEVSHKLSETLNKKTKEVKLCRDCLDIVNAEIELMKIENRFSKLLNPLYSTHKPTNELPWELKQWRFMIYFEEIEDKQDLEQNLFLHLNFNKEFSVYPIKTTKQRLNFIKVSFVYIQKGNSLEEFLKHFEAEIRISKENNWYNPIASARTKPFDEFKEETKAVCRRSFLLFRNSTRAVHRVHCKVGISFDGVVKSKNLNLDFVSSLGVYIGKNSFFKPEPLPHEWIKGLNKQLLLTPNTTVSQDPSNSNRESCKHFERSRRTPSVQLNFEKLSRRNSSLGNLQIFSNPSKQNLCPFRKRKFN